jgi:hypothetical protein
VKAALAFQLFANIYVFLMVDVKHRWLLKFFQTPMSFNGECESIVGLRSFCQHLCVLMATFAFKHFANTYVF